MEACIARIKELITNIETIFGSAKFVFVLAFHNFPGAPAAVPVNAKCVYNGRDVKSGYNCDVPVHDIFVMKPSRTFAK